MRAPRTYFLIVYLALFAVLGCMLAAHASAAPTLDDDIAIARAYWGWPHSPYCTTEAYEEKEILWGGEAESPDSVFEAAPCSMRVITIAQLEDRVEHLLPTEPGFVPEPSEYAPKALELRCRIAVHEYGHWLGLGHSTDPTNPMYTPISFKAIIPACEARLHEGEAPPRVKRKRHRGVIRNSPIGRV